MRKERKARRRAGHWPTDEGEQFEILSNDSDDEQAAPAQIEIQTNHDLIAPWPGNYDGSDEEESVIEGRMDNRGP